MNENETLAALKMANATIEARNAEIARLRAQRDTLMEAAKAYLSECENPVPDYVLRRALRIALFRVVSEMEREP